MQNKLSEIYGERIKLYGPYKCSDERLRVDICTSIKKTTHQYARVLLEVKLNRRLGDHETVDHIDGNKFNDDPSNLRVMTLSENSSDSAFRLLSKEFTCPQCSNKFTLSGNKLSNAIRNRNSSKAGPFCNRSCAGKYGSDVQHGKRLPACVITIDREYINGKGETKNIQGC